MKKTLEKLIREALPEAGDFVVEHPGGVSHGDYSTNVALVAAKGLGKNPREVAEAVVAYIESVKPVEIERLEIAGPGFINFYLSQKFFAQSVADIVEKGESFGKGEHAKGFKMLVEHTQPNPFKEFHIGHLMNNTIGEAVARIIAANGAEVKTASYHGDVGMHVAKAVWAMKQGIDFADAYARGNTAFEEDERAKEEITLINKQIYDKSDPEITALYEEGRKKSLGHFEGLYERLGSHFDFHFYESESGEIGAKIVREHVGRIFEESEGAVVYKGEKIGLHTRVFLNKEGLPTYEAKEVGLAKIKRERYAYDQSLTITANEQDAFFDVVEAAIGEVFPELKGKLKHLSHGVLRLPTGKMSSRTGNVIAAESLIDEVKEKTKGNEEVAIAAIKYMILRSNIGSDIIFDVEKSVSTEGDSGVYLQYAHARAGSVLEKAGKRGNSASEQGQVREVERLLYRFPEIIERAGAEYAPNLITTYLTELAASFNNFYAHEQVISDDVEAPYRLAIVEAFKTVMKNGLTVLGIPAPERI